MRPSTTTVITLSRTRTLSRAAESTGPQALSAAGIRRTRLFLRAMWEGRQPQLLRSDIPGQQPWLQVRLWMARSRQSPAAQGAVGDPGTPGHVSSVLHEQFPDAGQLHYRRRSIYKASVGAAELVLRSGQSPDWTESNPEPGACDSTSRTNYYPEGGNPGTGPFCGEERVSTHERHHVQRSRPARRRCL